MSELKDYAEATLVRARLLRRADEKGMWYTDEAEKPVVEHQLRAAEVLAQAVTLLAETMEECLSDSFDETLRNEMTTALRESAELCSQ